MLLLALGLLVLRPTTGVAAIAGFAALALSMGDWLRWQPWVFQYTLMLFVFVLAARRPERFGPLAALSSWRIIVAFIYIWSGLSKLNGQFLDDVFPWLIEPLAPWWPSAWTGPAGAAVPFIEFLVGVGLLTRLRMPAVLTATGMHLFVLVLLGPIGHDWNSVIWPWNIAQIALVWLLFADRSPRLFTLKPLWRSPATATLLAIATLFPALHQFGAWDTYLSWSLYSGMGSSATVYIAEDTADRLPAEMQNHLAPAAEGEVSVDLTSWSISELNVPDYPEPRIQRRVFSALCDHSVSSGDMILELSIPSRSGRLRTEELTCEQVRPSPRGNQAIAEGFLR